MSERLTEKGGMSLFQLTENVNPNKAVECYNKLSELEDIEEELGIDLITLFKALKDGVWSTCPYQDIWRMRLENRKKQKLFYFDQITIDKDHIGMSSSGDDTVGEYVMKFKDYGKTWSLRKKDLE